MNKKEHITRILTSYDDYIFSNDLRDANGTLLKKLKFKA
jgi:hypothetical protein